MPIKTISNIGLGKHILWITCFFVFLMAGNAQKSMNASATSLDNVFEEIDGFLMVEAENFYKQSLSSVRQWYRTTEGYAPAIKEDEDENHSLTASGKTYIELLPDTRVTHEDSLIRGENFSEEPGTMAVVHFKVKINEPGRYYVWVRALSTGSEDNGLHVGINGTWPDYGQRMQWCDGKNQWTWGNSQRTKEEHCGVPMEIYLDIHQKGVHEIQFSMREDGFEFDQFILTRDRDFNPPQDWVSPAVTKSSYKNLSKPKIDRHLAYCHRGRWKFTRSR